jgi:chemotaxis protein MotD
MTMMDALSAPRLPVSEGAAQQSAAGRADKAEGDGAFSKVLSKSGEQQRGPSKEEHAEGDRSTAEVDGDHAAAKKVSSGFDRTQFAVDDTLIAELEALPDDASMGDLVRLLTNAKMKGKGLEKAGREPEVEIQGLDPAIKAELAKAMAAMRAGKGTDASEEVSAEQTATEAANTEMNASDLADLLRLLAGGENKASEKGSDIVKGEKSAKDEQKAVEGLAVATVSEKQTDASTADGDRSGGNRDFRFVRADGKGEPVILRSEGSSPADQAEPKIVETVTVVDSRRYIAPVSTTNGASITAAMLGDSEWVGAMSPGSELANAATQSSQGKVVHTLKIQMTPIELGSVTATLRLSGEELSVQLTVDNPAALRQLSNDQTDILKALRAQGLVVDQVQVNMQVATVDRSADANQNNTQNQQSGQQAFQPGSQSGSERQRQGEAAGNGTRVADERQGQTTDTSAIDARGARPDQLYI